MPRTLLPDSIKSRPWRCCVTVPGSYENAYTKRTQPSRHNYRVNELAAEKQYTADLIKAVEANPEVCAVQGVP